MAAVAQAQAQQQQRRQAAPPQLRAPTARAAALQSRMALKQRAPPMSLALNDRERVFGVGRGATRAHPSLAQMATQPDNRPHFAHFLEPSGAVRVGTTHIHASGIKFGDVNYNMRAEDLDIMEELGHGNYGSVRRALHKPTQTFMAIKETRLALDKDADQRIVRELEILHNARSAHIIDFHGAFTAEGSIYSLIEYMDAGSLDKLTGFEVNIAYRTVTGDEAVWGGMPEVVLKRICSSTVKGLHFLKNDLDVMHRDVKPTNVLMNLRGQVKVCDFGVSKQLENSKVARTNIGCQTYMAPERIQGESRQSLGDYTVAADVWSVGLTAIEVACGHYPWPMNFMSEAFAQLSCIMHGDLPTLPPGYSEAANHWVDGCLNRNPDKRPTYQHLIDHPWLADDNVSDADMISWTANAYRFKGSRRITPAPPVGA